MGHDRSADPIPERISAAAPLRAGGRRLLWLVAVATLLVALTCVGVPAPAAYAVTITVNDIGDDPDDPGTPGCQTVADPTKCTLRAAIEVAEALGGSNEIKFHIGAFGTLQQIQVASDLPPIATALVIDGWSQGGSTYTGAPSIIIVPASISDPPSGVGLSLLDDLSTSGPDPKTIKGLAIGGFDTGIEVCGCSGPVGIVGSYVGVKPLLPSGISRVQNRAGIAVEAAADVTIGGTGDSEGNVIAGNLEDGITATSGGGTPLNLKIIGNFIGTDRSGTTSLGNLIGVNLIAALDVEIGDGADAGRNVISGNSQVGINSLFGSGLLVRGNYVGVAPNGTTGLPNGVGISLTDTLAFVEDPGGGDPLIQHPVRIGGTSSGDRNVISGNVADQVRIEWISLLSGPPCGCFEDFLRTEVQGNYIGLDKTGLAGVTNPGGATANGVHTINVSLLVIGGTAPGAGNVVSGNPVDGISVVGEFSFEVEVSGNRVGTDKDGTSAIGNFQDGISLLPGSSGPGPHKTIVGSEAPGSGNLVSGNLRHGIKLLRTRQETIVFHNLVGVNAIGGGSIGNLGDGILIQNASHIIVQENVVANNTLSGVVMMPRTGPDLGNVLAANAIYSNGLIGIDLTNTINVGGVNGKGDGKTDNADDGPTNFPLLSAATTSAVGTIIAGTLNGTPSTSFRVELFDSPSCDGGGFGEGRAFLGGLDVGTNASGDASFIYTVATIPNGHVVTATSTNPFQQTSEFSGCKDVTTAAILVTPTSGLITSELGQADTFTVALSTLPTSNVTISLSVKKSNGDPSTEATVSTPTLTFTPADGTTPKQVTVTGQPDTVADGNQVFIVATAPASSSDFAYKNMDAPDAAGVNQDAPTLPTVTVEAAQVTEGTGASVPMSFTVKLSPASTQVVTVNWQIVPGTATLADFAISDVAGSLSFQPGETTKSIVTNVAGDTAVEGTETFTMRLTGVTNAAIGVQFVTGTILDDDTIAGPCSPRPNIVINRIRSGIDQLVVTVTAGSGTIKKITFASAIKPMTNATVETIGPAGVITNTGTFTPPPGVTQQSFIIRRTAPHNAVMVSFVVEDGCGNWNTFIGAGPEGF